MKTEKSWWANIYVGLYDKEADKTYGEWTLRETCQKYCNDVGFCITLTPTTFIYTNGSEPGIIVGCIQYPRFPLPNEINKMKAMELAKQLMKASNQFRVSIMMLDEVIMLERENDL